MCSICEGERDLVGLQHTPIREPRKGFPREHVFAGRWQRLMQAKCCALRSVLQDYLGPIGQREASVAASVVTWLGTNIGQALLDDAKSRLSRSPDPSPSGYHASDSHLAAWAAENRRKRGYGGVRLLEILLAERSELDTVARPTADDYEVAEHVMFWLGQYDGQRFLEQCQAEVAALDQIKSLAGFVRIGKPDAPLAQEIMASRDRLAAAGPVAAAALEDLEACLATSESEVTLLNEERL